jgi:hypothetical protein
MVNFLLMITVGLVCLNLYNALCSLEMIGITFFEVSHECWMEICPCPMSNSEILVFFYELWYRAPFFKVLDYENVVFIQI